MQTHHFAITLTVLNSFIYLKLLYLPRAHDVTTKARIVRFITGIEMVDPALRLRSRSLRLYEVLCWSFLIRNSDVGL